MKPHHSDLTDSTTTQNAPSKPVLIIGHTGKTGARVLARLQASGIPVRGASRSSHPAFDWQDALGWDQVLEGARAAYICYHPDLAVPAAQAHMQQFIEQARRAGLEHLVLLSGRGEPGAQAAEQKLIESGLDWNVVRASWFNQNFSESFMAEGIQRGELALPAGSVPEPFVDAEDIADVAVAALTRPTLRNRVFEVTGPRAITFAQAVASIARASGRDIRFRTVPLEPWIEQLTEAGLPAEMTALLRELFSEVLDGRNSDPQNGVMEALGRPPKSFDDYARDCFGGNGIATENSARSAAS